MFRILDRYIFREIAQSWLAVTAVLLAILLTNQFARVLGDVAKDKLPKDAIFQIIGLTALQYLTILVPIGLFLAVMLALGRLYRDSEMPAMMACRVGPLDVYRPLSWLLVPLSLAVGWLAMAGEQRHNSPSKPAARCTVILCRSVREGAEFMAQKEAFLPTQGSLGGVLFMGF